MNNKTNKTMKKTKTAKEELMGVFPSLKNRIKTKTDKVKLMRVFHSMKQRCHNPRNPRYQDYGGAGVKVCKHWLDNPESFYTWAMDNGWNQSLQIDRKNNRAGYNPQNCRFVSAKQNCRNRSSNILVTAFGGETKTLVEWMEDDRANASYRTIHQRIIKLNWKPELAISLPPKKKAA